MKKIVLSISIVLFIILCFVFNKYDLDISIYLTQFYNGFYEFFDDVGEIPIYFGPILFGATYCTLSKKPLYKYLSACVSFIAFWIASVKIVGICS